MSNLFNDPFGLKLMKCNRPPKEQDPIPEEPEDNQESYYYCYSYPAFQPYYPIGGGSHQMVIMQQQFVTYHYPQQFYYPVAQNLTKPHQCEGCKKKAKSA